MKKLTLVSIWFRGRRFSAFMMLSPDERGKFHTPPLDDVFRACGCSYLVGLHGVTFTVG